MTKFKGVELTTYVDPFPGLKNTDKVQVECGCAGGVYTGPSHISWNIAGRGQNTYCFQCNGAGVITRGVQSQRRRAMQDAWEREVGGPQREAAAIEFAARQAADELAQAWDDAHAEAERRAQLVQGFVGQVGDKVVGLVGTVQVAKYMPSHRYGWSASMFIVVKLDNGQVVKISGSGQSLFDVERGDEVEVAGTVKDHQDYNGQDQTVLKSAKLVVVEREEVNA